MKQSDFLVIGSGLAGLVFAIKAAERGTVRVVTKRQPSEGSTAYAQGGIAAAVGPDDDLAAHERDTLECGGGICSPEAVALVIEHGPAGVQWLADQGVPFSRDSDGRFSLGREGGHTQRRVLHVKDATGRAIMDTLLDVARRHPRIEILPHHCVVDLIVQGKGKPGARVVGAYVLDESTRTIDPAPASATMLATGGTGKAYRYTSNPDIATGDGVAMAWRAGCRLANLEFVQFHPTCLYHPDAKDFLISEAARGEGGYLTTLTGEPLEIPHPLGNLAPRDVVARAIDQTMKTRGERSVYLHLETLGAERMRTRFPNIYETCLSFAIDITKQPIP
ncbi:MAG: FAD-dependent oxidoreductase, partial [Candidatus Eisenbacteria bacterium]|nr:FAD-dependent oxidoreductase [Candidatus Eisenbacteria bacterium]